MKDYYAAALKAGQKQYKESIAAQKSPYLPVLDEMLPVDKLSGGVDIGLVQIPVKWIVGTKTAGRTTSFASNFMPIAEENSEFASKWKRLCESHLQEGIRDPVKAYEYMNRYYIEEGNKRVSVLKFFEAVTIPGQVIRIMPDRDGSEAVELYYEFVDFYNITKINFIEFSQKGSYKEFLRLLGREDKNSWNDEVVRSIRTDFFYFSRAFRDLGGEKTKVNAADAMLLYIRIYGYDSLRGKGEEQMHSMLSKAWKEIVLLQEENPIDVVEDPEQDSSQGIFSKIIPAIIPRPKHTVNALYLYGRKPENSSWVAGHEKGRLEAQKRLDGQMTSNYIVCEAADPENGTEDIAEAVMRGGIKAGVNVIFATAAEMMPACLKVAIDHPETAILNCSLNVSHKAVRAYYPRMYEAKFISGAIAGAMCTNNKIGYINNYPVFGNIAEINAFARGVQLSNAHAKVYLEWANDDSLHEKAVKLVNNGISLISVRNRSQNGENEKYMFGLQQVENGTVRELVAPVWNWGNYYEQILRSILDGSFQMQSAKAAKSLNYYWGMSSDVVGIQFSESLPRGIRYLGELIQKAIRMGVCRPFYDPKPDETGKMQWHNVKATISMEEIINMDWLESNVVGAIPNYDQLTDRAKKLVDVIGVGSARKKTDAD